MAYYHGGPPKLKVFGRILPPRVTGAPSTAQYGAEGICDTSKVYITTDPQAAKVFACMHPSGVGEVYEVRPIGELSADPDCSEPGLSWQCDSAKIVRKLSWKIGEREYLRAALIKDFAEVSHAS